MENAHKTVIVTGASQGIGAGAVQAFLQRGYRVVANSRNITRANPFPASADLALVDGDIGDPDTAAKIVDTAVAQFGRIDALVNNAGTSRAVALEQLTDRDLDAFYRRPANAFQIDVVAKRLLVLARRLDRT